VLYTFRARGNSAVIHDMNTSAKTIAEFERSSSTKECALSGCQEFRQGAGWRLVQGSMPLGPCSEIRSIGNWDNCNEWAACAGFENVADDTMVLIFAT
jgi:hypothetical protein